MSRLSAAARSGLVTAVREDIHDLTRAYRPDSRGPAFPPLLDSLDYTRVLATPAEAGTARNGKPGSRPPADISWVSKAAQIRAEAIEWDADLRSSKVARLAGVALAAIPQNADLAGDDELKRLKSDVSSWHWGAAVLLGYLDPVLDMPKKYQKPCFDCHKSEVYVIARTGSGQCRGCGVDYSGARVRMLIRQSVA